jgi:hypothetical protein
VPATDRLHAYLRQAVTIYQRTGAAMPAASRNLADAGLIRTQLTQTLLPHSGATDGPIWTGGVIAALGG